jgi:hypothetical protein
MEEPIASLSFLHGCVMLISETRLSLRSVDLEMEFVLSLRERYKAHHRDVEP